MPKTYGNAIKLVSASSQRASRTTPSTQMNNYTVAFWLYIDTLPGGTVYLFGNGDTNPHQGWELYLTAGGNIGLDMVFVAGCNASVAFSAGVWHHVVYVRDAGTSKFYIDGVASGGTTGSQANQIGVTDIMTFGSKWDSGNGYGAYPDVTMDDCRYYERAISAAEALALKQYGDDILNGDISNTSLKVWLKMDESSGNPQDSSGNGNNFTANGSPAFINPGKVMLTHTNDTRRALLGVGA